MRSALSLYRTGRQIPDADRIYWTLSAKLARHFHGPTKLFADPESATRLTKEWGIEFDEVDTETIPKAVRGAHPMCWSAGKLAAMKKMAEEGEPFFHIDGDAFLFQALPLAIQHARLLAQCVEKRLRRNTAKYKRNTHYPINELVPFLKLPRFMRRFYTLNLQPVINMGIFGGNDLNSIQEYAEISLKTFVYNRHNVQMMSQFQRRTGHWLGIAALAEQWSLGAYCYDRGITPATILDRIDSYNLNRAHEVGGFVHLFSCCRRLKQYRKWAKRKFKNLEFELLTVPLEQAA